MEIDGRNAVAVVGAGLAGLTAASFLRRQRVPVVLFESGPKIAGLATSFSDPDGFTYDFGAHFITNRLAAALGVAANCRTVRYYGESVRYHGKTYGYPLGLLLNPRFVLSGISSRLNPMPEEVRNDSAADWFRGVYGRELADRVALPLLEAWSGAQASELAASVGNKLQNTIGQTLWLKSVGRFLDRAVACGYSHEVPENMHVWHVYPNGGLGLLCQRLADELQDLIRLESPVEQIQVESGRVASVRVRGCDIPVGAVISTAPVHILAKLVQGTDALRPFSRFRYRPMVFVNLRFEGRGLLPDTVLWTPEREFPFFRLTETPLSMPWLAPDGKTLITADLGCEVGDAVWEMEDAALGELCVERMERIIDDPRGRFLGCRVLRTPIAYPIYLKEYEADRLRLEESTGIEGLYSIGRNGEFSHSLMEDVYWRTKRKMATFFRKRKEDQTA